MGQRNSGSRSLGLAGGLLAFVLSAIMGVAFVMVVEKTHELFSADAFAGGFLVGAVSNFKSEISNLRFHI
jgi:hypothetical protein